MSEHYKKSKGRWAEDCAASFLQKNDWKIRARNYKVPLPPGLGRRSQVEIDIIATKEKMVCFFEVKFRPRTDMTYAHWEIVSRKQQQRIGAALHYNRAVFAPNSLDWRILWVDELGLVHFIEKS